MPNSKINTALAMVKQALKAIMLKFEINLTSVIIYGHLARNDSNFEGIGMLTIVKSLPEDWRRRDEIAIEIEKIGFGFGMPLSMQLITDKEFEFSITNGAPLLFEISLAYKAIYDTGFFKQQMERLKENMLRWNAKKIDNAWVIPGLAVEAGE